MKGITALDSESRTTQNRNFKTNAFVYENVRWLIAKLGFRSKKPTGDLDYAYERGKKRHSTSITYRLTRGNGGGVAGAEGGLKVVAADPAVDVEDFSGNVQPRCMAAQHRA